ncbi:acyltransferase family protein [Amnibacterium endophyticum]|uniref:Acyltransferase family protein n=1 Tax=Amnibacterium endophyticum TaxID=2109337 RepID=A0ABW4LDS5_9MICO
MRATLTTATSYSRPFDHFQRTRYFPALDGLRAISILLVIGLHSQDGLWMKLHGTIGVTVFFVISGWLITTLLLREETRAGRVHLGRFYLRRGFRLLPVYFAVLAIFVLLIVVLNLQWGHDAFIGSLPYYLTYQNDWAPTSLFGHTWSLAIEEKFYVVWPLLAFAVAAVRRVRIPMLIALLAFTLAAEQSQAVPVYYLATYTPLVLGCLLAVLMHDRRTYRWIAALTHPAFTGTVVTAAVVQALLFEGIHGHVHTLFSFLTVLALPGVLVGAQPFGRVLSVRPLVYVGTRSYALYLVHPLVVTVVGYVIPAGSSNKLVEMAHLAAIVGISLAIAEVLYRLVEQPLIRAGRRLMAPRQVAPSIAPTESGRLVNA